MTLLNSKSSCIFVECQLLIASKMRSSLSLWVRELITGSLLHALDFPLKYMNRISAVFYTKIATCSLEWGNSLYFEASAGKIEPDLLSLSFLAQVYDSSWRS